MTDITTMVARLVAAGCPPEVAAQTVAEAYAEGLQFAFNQGRIPVDSTAEKRRTWDRERKRKQASSPPDSTGFHRIPQNASLSKEDKKEEGKKEREAPETQFHRKPDRGHRLPEDWEPPPPDQAIAFQLLGPDRTASELEKFRDHWKQQPGSKGVKLDWNAAWRNWTRRAAEYGAQRNGRRTVHDAANDLIAKFSAFDEPAPGGLRSGAGEDAIRMLPAGRRQ